VIDTRIRGRKGQRIRHAHLLAYPLCVHCEAKGIFRIAEEIDHIVPLFKGGLDEKENRCGLCRPCHRAKTTVDMGYSPRQRIGLDGFPSENP
jgi:5-methylcytosine-specific restriction enzyme A